MTAIEIVSAGMASSIRDAGRVGSAHLGSSRGGAVDLAALHLGNRLVGNLPSTAAFETSGGLVLRAHQPVMVAVTGSPVDLAVDAGPPVGWGMPAVLPSGAVLRIGRLRGGARCYVAVRGGVTRAGGDDALFDVGLEPGQSPSPVAAVPRTLDRSVRVWRGPRADWFESEAWAQLLASAWSVLPDSDRMGLRLDGPPLQRLIARELPSEGLVEGAIQVPPDGRPIVMLADHPATGGYPVLAVVDPADLGLVAQRPPGSTLTFVPATRRPRVAARHGCAESLG
ncbi:MAG: allophanate hydrolase, subunit2 [Actinomycetota bacterium]|jgi:allophanate hydrolase subunit 2